MPGEQFCVGLDFGTESGRAVLVDVNTGAEVANAVSHYQNGVMDSELPLPEKRVALGPGWALQDPQDYIRVLRDVIPAVLRRAGVDSAEVAGIGVSCTASSVVPVKA